LDNNEFKEIRPDAQEMECRFEYTIDLEESEQDHENPKEVVTDESVTVEARSTFRARRKKEELSWQRNLLLYLHDLVYLLAAVILVFLLCFRVVVVSGTSMNHTLLDGDYLLLLGDVFYRNPERGDIIVASKDTFDNGAPIVKRVIATEGQWVDVDRGAQTVTIYDENFENPQILDESAYRYLDSGKWMISLAMSFPVQVPEDHVFVMGDNRNNSSDSSTSDVIGFVDERRILGRVVQRLIPAHKFGPVE
jgi:signal peptidase I